MARGLRPVAAGGHVAPSAPAVLGAVVEDACAADVGAAADAGQLAQDESIGRGLDDGNHETGKRVTDGNERARVGAIAAPLHAARAGTASEHTIDLAKRLVTNLLAEVHPGAALRQRAKRGAHTPGADERGRGTRRLFARAPTHAERPLRVEQGRRLEPHREGPESP